MRAFVMLSVLTVVTATAALAQTKAPAAAGGVDKLLRDKEEAILKSVESPTPDGMKALVAANAMSLDDSGWMPVSDFFAQWTTIKITGHSTSDMKVMPIDANAALVTYKLMQKGTVSGQAIPPVVYATTVWKKTGATWMAVFHQETPPAPPKGK
jgi:hypothetical protein